MTKPYKMVNRRYEGEGFFGMRHVQCLLCFFCLSLAYALRVNLSVALVAMTETQQPINNSSDANVTDAVAEIRADEDKWLTFDTYNWNLRQQSYMQSSFFWGYIVMQVPAGTLAQRYGAKMLLMYGILLCALLTILTPISVTIGGWQLLCLLRFLEGVTQGAVHPATHVMLARWAPPEERGMLGTLCYSGSQFGTVIMLATSGFIADSPLGWPGIFYISGSVCFVWAILWYIFAASSPEDSRYISPEELKFIETALGNRKNNTVANGNVVPWTAILKSLPFLSLLVVHCTHMFGFWTLLTQIPTYMKKIYEVDIKDSALLSSLPYTVMLILSFFFVWLSRVLASSQRMPLSFNRKLFNTIGHWIPMCSLIALGFVPKENAPIAVALLTVTVGISAATYLGFQVNHIDLSPNYAGTLMGLTNGAANVMSAIAPLVVGQIVKNDTNVTEWRYVFFLAAAGYFFGNLLFIILGRTEVQWWNTPNVDRHAEAPLKPADGSQA